LKLIDSSVILRFLTGDDPRKAERARKLLLESDERLLISDTTCFEVVYALEKEYGRSRDEIFNMIAKMLSLRRLEFVNRDILLKAIILYREHAVPIGDAYQVALGRELGAEGIYTYDVHVEKKLNYPAEEP
jgi:predicted nucleic acid-binding protein